MLDYDALKCFHEVLRYGGFEKGAQALNLTQSAVSQKIKRLEQSVGGPVLVRTKPLRATPLGKELLAHIQKVSVLEEALNIQSGLEAQDQTQTRDILQQGRVMACISQTGTPVTGGQSIRLGTMRYQLYASPRFIERYLHKGISPERVMKTPGLLYDEYDVTLLSDYQRECLDIAPSFTTCHWFPSSHGFVKMALDGVVWALLPTLQVEQEVSAGELVPLFPQKELGVPLFWHWTTLESAALADLTKAVKKVAKAQLK